MAPYIFIVCFLICGALAAEEKWPEYFPDRRNTSFSNWADDINVHSLYTVDPKTAEEVVNIANWARRNNYTVRASGRMHTWTPLTVMSEHPSIYDVVRDRDSFKYPFDHEAGEHDNKTRILLLKTGTYLNKLGIINSDPENASFWSEPGILLDDLVRRLENNELGFLATPAMGKVTLGGALAVGAYGTGVPARGEKLSRGHTYGSLSNLIMGFTAVVYDEDLDKYVLKTFSRSDPESRAFLVNLGRTFITNYTMRAGPLQFLECASFTNISANDLFANPRECEGKWTISRILDLYGRMEVTLFPFTNSSWLKVWNVAYNQPKASTRVFAPYNYDFSYGIPKGLAMAFGLIQSKKDMVKVFSPSAFEAVKVGLSYSDSGYMWGPARTVHHYVKPDSFRMAANGYAIHTARKNVQSVVYKIYRIYQSRLEGHASKESYPINGPLEIRVTGVDNSGDVMMKGATTVGIAPSSPVRQRRNRYPFDTVVRVSVLTFPKSKNIAEFMRDLESDFYGTFKGDYAFMRVEWAKGWAYNGTTGSPWKNTTVMTRATNDDSSSGWKYTRRVLNAYDPFNIFTNEFLQNLFETNKSE